MKRYGGERGTTEEKWDSGDQEVTCYAVRGKCSFGRTLSRDYRYTFTINVLDVQADGQLVIARR